MRTQAVIHPSKVKKAINAVKDQKPDPVRKASFTQQAQLAKLQRKLGKRLKPLFTDAGVDLKEIDAKLNSHQGEVRQWLKKEEAKTAKQFARLEKQRQAGFNNTRRAIELIALKPFLSTQIPVPTPFLISAKPAGILSDSQVVARNNLAKAAFSIGQDTSHSTANVNFYFAWQNPSNFLAVINCSADLITNGLCGAWATPGFLFGGTASITVRAELTVFAGPIKISWQQDQTKQLESLSAHGGGIFGFGDVLSSTISDTAHLSCKNIEVQGNQLIVFDVALTAEYSIDDGNVSIDFASGSQEIVCPGVTVELLTPPAGGALTPDATT
ncbi:hypothetical protein YTPLAS72_26680 [Nitrospira sp.]|nr:hypothetical protein YTPLAS72_26680 [Nitrospira sp.]